GHARGLVDDEQIDLGEAADRVFLAGDAANDTLVVELELVDGAALEVQPLQAIVHAADLGEELARLAEAGRDDEDARAGAAQGLDQGADGDDRRLAGLPATVEE